MIRLRCAGGERVDGTGGNIEGLFDKVHGRLIYDILAACNFRDKGQPASRKADLGAPPNIGLGGGIEGAGDSREVLERGS